MKLHSQRLSQLHDHFFASLEVRIARLKAGGREIIRLDMGSPDLPPAEHILQALHHSAEQPDHHAYQPLRGSAALRQAWSAHYEQHYGVKIDANTQVLPLLGSKEGLFLITQAVVDPGDVVLVPDPGYLVYAQAARFAGAEAYPLPLHAANGWLPDLEAVPTEVLRRARLMFLNYPNNPTSAVASREFFDRVVEFACQHDLLLCQDAAYSLVLFDGSPPASLLQVPGAADVALEFNTLSKAYNMAGWRIGAALGNPQAVQALHSLSSSVTSGHFRPAVEGAIAALTGDQAWILERNAIYQRRRDLVLSGLRFLGWQAETPQAALYVWFQVPQDGQSSADFCLELLETSGVSLTPGSIFGSHGEGYVRLSFTLPEAEITKAFERIAAVQGTASQEKTR